VRRFASLLKNELVTGMVLLAPAVGTIYLVFWIVSGIDRLFPSELRPRIFGVPLPGLGVLSVLVIALLVGVFAHNFVGRRLVDWIDRAFTRVPLFGGTYGLIKQVFESVFSQGAESFSRAVLVEYPQRGSFSIGFVTSSQVASGIPLPAGQAFVSVFVPTTPNPTSGFYLLVDSSLVRDLEIPVEQAFKLVITMGIAREPAFVSTTAKMSRSELKSVVES
jgi:uncharacterized membrane protein